MYKYPKIGSILDLGSRNYSATKQLENNGRPLQFIINAKQNSNAIVLDYGYFENQFKLKVFCNGMVGWIYPSVKLLIEFEL